MKMRGPSIHFILLSLIVATTSMSRESLAEWPAATADQEQQVLRAVEAILKESLQQSSAPGVSAAIVLGDGTVIASAAGFADREEEIPMTAETLLLGGSTGKSFVAATTMSLVDDGVLNLDSKVSEWLGAEEWFDRLPNHSDLTLRVLLNHSSGVPDHIYTKSYQIKAIWNIMLDEEFYFSPAELVEFILDDEALAPSGQSYAYADTNYILVGMVIEKATGNSYYSELQRRVLTPLALDSITPSNTNHIPGLSAGYVKGGFVGFITRTSGKNMDDGKLNINPAIEWTGGGLAGTPTDLARFYSALMRGELVSSESLHEMTTSTIDLAGRTNTAYGLGIFVISNEEFGHYIHHSGWFPGYRTNAIYYSDYGFSVVVQFNQDDDVDIYSPVKEIARAVITTLLLEK